MSKVLAVIVRITKTEQEMKRLLLPLLAALVLPASESSFASFPIVFIKDCYDGDTCTSSEGEKIRLACIDTPEIRGKRAKPNEAIAAKNFLNEMIKGEKVSIRRVTEDKYGRTVGELSFNGENLQQLLVKEGHAEIYKKYSKPCEWAS